MVVKYKFANPVYRGWVRYCSNSSGKFLPVPSGRAKDLSAPLLIKDEKSDMVADSHSILTRWSDYFSQLLNVYGVNDVRQTEIHTA
jgi:hypothetical protein